MAKRKLTHAERAVWGVCPECNAAEGEACTEVEKPGIMARMTDGAHLGRLHNAPVEVDETPVETDPEVQAAPADAPTPDQIEAWRRDSLRLDWLLVNGGDDPVEGRAGLDTAIAMAAEDKQQQEAKAAVEDHAS